MKRMDASKRFADNPTRARGGRGGAFPSSVLGVLMLIAATTDAVFAFGPYPVGTTIFVDAANIAAVESGTSTQPFNTIQEGIDAAPIGATVGVAPGLYTGNQNHNLVISKPLKLMGYDTQSTVIKAPTADPPPDVVLIKSGDVRIAGFTIIGAQENFNPFPDNVGISIPPAASLDSVRIERMVLTGSCFGIAGNGGIVDRTVISDAKCVAMLTSRLHVTNSLILDNAQGLTSVSPPESPVFVVNNTFVGNKSSGLQLDTTGIVSNNVFVLNTNGVFWSTVTSSPPPQVLNNLFYGNSETNLAFAKPTPVIAYNTASEINGLPGNSGNIVGDPKFVDAGADDFHFVASSPAIDAGDNATAPPVDFDGHTRPVDADGNCSAIVDIGAYEVHARRSVYPCYRYVFEPDGPWILSGCEIIDCCPGCPGANILDWEIYVAGHPVKEFILRFDGLDAATLRGIGIEGRAQWISANQLLVTGDRVALHGLPFARNGESGTLRMTAESFAADKRITGRLAVGVTQSVAGRQIAQATLKYLPADG